MKRRLISESNTFLQAFLSKLSSAGLNAATVSQLLAQRGAMAEWIAAIPGSIQRAKEQELEDAELRKQRRASELEVFAQDLPNISFGDLEQRDDQFAMAVRVRNLLGRASVTTLSQLVLLDVMPVGLSEIEGVDKYICLLCDTAGLKYPAWLVETEADEVS